jgi:Zn-dependent alcohol dehydrogenase
MLADLYLSGRRKSDELITKPYALDEVERAVDELRQGGVARGVCRFD